MDELTPNFGFIKPEINPEAPEDSWAHKWGQNIDNIDAVMAAISGSILNNPQSNVDLSGLSGTVTSNTESIASLADAINGQDGRIATLENSVGGIASGTYSGVTVRQTVVTGKVDASGQANFLEVSGSYINLRASEIDPVEVAFAAGFNKGAIDHVERIVIDQLGAWGGFPANSTVYLYMDRNAVTGQISYGYTTLAPIYSDKKPVSTASSIPVMTSNNTPSPYVVSASSSYSSAYAAYLAFNGVTTGTGWASANGLFPQELKADHGSAKTIGSYTIYPNTAFQASSPKNWTIQGSNDDVNYTVIDTRTNQTSWTGPVTYNISNPGAYRYYKIVITANCGAAGETDIVELKLFETAQTNQFWFDLNTFMAKLGNGSIWQTKQMVYIGQTTTDSFGNPTSVISYALQAKYTSQETLVSPGTTYNFNHNTGYTPDQITMSGVIRDVANDFVLPYAVVDNYDYQSSHNDFGSYPSITDRLKYQARMGSSYTMGYVDPFGNIRQIGTTNGAGLTITIKRNW